LTADCSILISAKNEHDLLPYILSWCRNAFNDAVLLDDNSTDDTVQIAKSFKCRVFKRQSDAEAFGANIRIELQDLAVYDWCFHCDADELIDFNMLSKITYWTKPDSPDRLPNVVAFKFPRYNPNGRAWPDWQIRLVNRQYVTWRRPVHPEALFKRTMRPVDEPETINGKQFKYCQSLDMHPFIHLPRPRERLEETRKRWATLEARSGVKPPTEKIESEPKPIPVKSMPHYVNVGEKPPSEKI
jgi:glycosyltransferase involved in cell wall biosynthesis